MKTLNGELKDFNPKMLMDSVKKNGQSLYVEVSHEDKAYYISIHFEGIFGNITDDTRYWVDIVSEDNEGNQERITGYKDWSGLTDQQVVAQLNRWKDSLING